MTDAALSRSLYLYPARVSPLSLASSSPPCYSWVVFQHSGVVKVSLLLYARLYFNKKSNLIRSLLTTPAVIFYG
jgi:hypothetical protein